MLACRKSVSFKQEETLARTYETGATLKLEESQTMKQPPASHAVAPLALVSFRSTNAVPLYLVECIYVSFLVNEIFDAICRLDLLQNTKVVRPTVPLVCQRVKLYACTTKNSRSEGQYAYGKEHHFSQGVC